MNRRVFLVATALSGVSAAELSACGGSANSVEASAVASAEATQWNIVPPPTLVPGSPAIMIDLRLSLPAHVRRGGRFAVSSTGAALPPGVKLSTEGELFLVTGDVSLGITPGVVFTYEEPVS